MNFPSWMTQNQQRRDDDDSNSNNNRTVSLPFQVATFIFTTRKKKALKYYGEGNLFKRNGEKRHAAAMKIFASKVNKRRLSLSGLLDDGKVWAAPAGNVFQISISMFLKAGESLRCVKSWDLEPRISLLLRSTRHEWSNCVAYKDI